MPSEAEKSRELHIVRSKAMDTLASKVGSAVLDLLSLMDASFFMPTWYSAFLDTYCYDAVRLGYHAIAVGLFILASFARVMQKRKHTAYFELFPRIGGEEVKLGATHRRH